MIDPTKEIRVAVLEWAELFNHGEFFHAHEVLEPLWLRASEPARSLFKGLIHAAVALVHYGRGNAHGARVKSRSSVHYLTPLRDCVLPIDLGELIGEMERVAAALDALPQGAALPPVSLPKVRLKPDADAER